MYTVHNLPIPLMSNNQTNMLLKYSLENEMLLTSRDRAKFSFLSESAFQMCNSYHFQFCNPETAFYQTNINTFCVIALFMQNVHDIKKYCFK